jgi:hypothetical protein
MYVEATAPRPDAVYRVGGGALLASAEQSFMWLHDQRELRGRHMSVTPCFRKEEQYSHYTLPSFLKLELIDVGDVSPESLCRMVGSAASFFRKEGGEVVLVDTSRDTGHLSFDLLLEARGRRVEVGSYGIRSMKLLRDLTWIYGTGLAEPRTSVLLNETLGQ